MMMMMMMMIVAVASLWQFPVINWLAVWKKWVSLKFVEQLLYVPREVDEL